MNGYVVTRLFTDGGDGHSYATELVFENTEAMQAYESSKPEDWNWTDDFQGVVDPDYFSELKEKGRSVELA